MHDATNDPWFPYMAAAGSEGMPLFCLHHAGGGASIYADWRARLAPGITVLALQLPGREGRLNEAPYRSMTALVPDVMRAMHPYLKPRFALFGHSFGAALAFELSRRLDPPPSHLFISSWSPPAAPASRHASRLGDAEFTEWLLRYGGIPEALLRDREVMAELLKVLRADVEVLEGYRPPLPQSLPCPTSIFGGIADTVATPRDLGRWSVCQGAARPRFYPGGHFYFTQALPAVLHAVSRTLLPEAAA